jgi:hypothetical protein
MDGGVGARQQLKHVILKSTSVISTLKVQFPPAECDFPRRVSFPHTSVILTLPGVITTRSSAIYTRRV